MCFYIVHVLGIGVIYMGGAEPDDLYLYLCRSWLELSRRQAMEHGQLDSDGQLLILFVLLLAK